MLSSGCQPAHLKRKRHSSEHNPEEDNCDIENLPTNEEKKYKDDSRLQEPGCSFEREGDRRQPFSELKMVSQESNIELLVSEQERLSISDEAETTSLLNSCDVANFSDLSPEALSSLGESPCILTPGTSVRSPSSCMLEEVDAEVVERLNPLPHMPWADLPSLWQLMLDKDEESVRLRNPDVFSQHPSLLPRMRAVLLDWITEVCDVYKLHRETYYMTMDYLDRFLTAKSNVPKQQLQLIGVTCLQLACKNEEIYPPKMAEYAYVTDGACTETEIVSTELIICKTLDWRLNPVTPIYWLKVFLQICYQDKSRHDLGFFFPQFSAKLYQRVAHLLNLSTLDAGSLRFSYSVLAASALYIACSPQLAVQVSGWAEEDLSQCVYWMTPFWDVLVDEVPEYKKKCNKLMPGFTKATVLEDGHNLQRHDISLTMMDSAVSESLKRAPSCLMTPPSSSKKLPTQESLAFT